ncbi:MAG: RHS repeat-associated core domain-containing protein [Clostridia bacterium]|nr:RHS repeat-associated core domain-containing protein [Clostridia bacterium]
MNGASIDISDRISYTESDDIATKIAKLNPFLYRGYCYDRETRLYYLNARYYDPQVGRFICPDDISYLDPTTINGLNLYAYCGNNPVMNQDANGNSFTLAAFLITVGVTALLGAIDGGVTAQMSGQNFWKGFAAGAIGGAVGGAINYFLPGAGNLLGRAASTMIYDITNEIFQTGTFDINNLGIYIADTIMDVGLSMLYLDKVGSIASSFISAAVGGTIDAGVDILQTELYFSPKAQQRIRGKKRRELIQFV